MAFDGFLYSVYFLCCFFWLKKAGPLLSRRSEKTSAVEGTVQKGQLKRKMPGKEFGS